MKTPLGIVNVSGVSALTSNVGRKTSLMKGCSTTVKLSCVSYRPESISSLIACWTERQPKDEDQKRNVNKCLTFQWQLLYFSYIYFQVLKVKWTPVNLCYKCLRICARDSSFEHPLVSYLIGFIEVTDPLQFSRSLFGLQNAGAN